MPTPERPPRARLTLDAIAQHNRAAQPLQRFHHLTPIRIAYHKLLGGRPSYYISAELTVRPDWYDPTAEIPTLERERIHQHLRALQQQARLPNLEGATRAFHITLQHPDLPAHPDGKRPYSL